MKHEINRDIKIYEVVNDCCIKRDDGEKIINEKCYNY